MKNIFLLFLLIFVQQSFAQNTELKPYRYKKLWGYSDAKGKIIIQPVYDSVTTFKSNNFLKTELAFVFKNKQAGIINNQNKLLIPTVWDEIDYLKSQSKFINALLVKKNNKYGIINYTNDTIISIEFDRLQTASVINSEHPDYIYTGQIGHYYFILNDKGYRIEVSYSEYDKLSRKRYYYFPNKE